MKYIWHYPAFWCVVLALIGFAVGMSVNHQLTKKSYGVPNYKVSGGSMSPTFDSGDQLIIRDILPGEQIQIGWIVRFTLDGDPDNVKRVMALAGQSWQDKIVPGGYVALWGDCRHATDPYLPLIPVKDVTGVVTGVHYAEFWESPEGKQQIPEQSEPKVMPPQDPIKVEGINILRVDQNNLSLTEIGVPGDVSSYYRQGDVILEESTSKAYHVKDVGFDPEHPPMGITRLLTVEQFGSITNDGRVVLLAPEQQIPRNIGQLFTRLP